MATFFHRLKELPAQIHPDQLGIYRCAQCGQLLFTTYTRFAAGNDWASFWAPAADQNIEIRQTKIEGLRRREVICAVCESHLGYEFNDGPAPTRRRLSVLLTALRFHPNPPRNDRRHPPLHPPPGAHWAE